MLTEKIKQVFVTFFIMNHILPTTAFTLICFCLPANADDLMSIYQKEQKNDPQYQGAIYSDKAVAESKNQAKALFLPDVSTQIYYKKNRIDQGALDLGYDTSGYIVGLTQPLYNKKNRHTLSQSDYAIGLSKAMLAQTKSTLILRVAIAYFGVLEAIDTLELSKAELKSIGTQLGDIQQQFDVGLVAITDLNESQARYDLAVSNKLLNETELDIANAQLRFIIGIDPGKLRPLKSNIRLSKPNPNNVTSWLQIALKNSPEIKAQRMNSETAREEIAKQRAGHYPTLDLTADYGKANTELPTSANSDSGSVGLEFNMPLYKGGAIKSATREAKHRFDESTQNFIQTKRSVDNKVRTYFLNVISDIKQINAAKQSLKSTRTALEASSAGFEAGTRTSIDVLNSRSELFAAKSTLAQARYKYLLDHMRLKDAAGVLKATDLQVLNTQLR